MTYTKDDLEAMGIEERADGWHFVMEAAADNDDDSNLLADSESEGRSFAEAHGLTVVSVAHQEFTGWPELDLTGTKEAVFAAAADYHYDEDILMAM